MKIFQVRGAIDPQAEFWWGIFLLVVLVLNDADALMTTGPPPWYVWPVGLGWLALSVRLIRRGRRHMREAKNQLPSGGHTER